LRQPHRQSGLLAAWPYDRQSRQNLPLGPQIGCMPTPFLPIIRKRQTTAGMPPPHTRRPPHGEVS